MDALRLALLGMWRRRGISLVVLAVAVAAVAAATAGPLYLRAGQQSLLRDDLAAAPAAATGIEVTALAGERPGAKDRLLATVSALTADLPAFAAPVGLLERDIQVASPLVDGQVQARLVDRDGQCEHLVMVSGRCPSQPGEVVISGTGARSLGGVATGQRLDVTGFYSQPGHDLTVTVVGIWQARDATEPYWFGRDYFGALRNAVDVSVIDAVFTVAGTFALVPAAPAEGNLNVGTPTRALVDLPVQPSRALRRDVPALRTALRSLPDRLAGQRPDVLLETFLGFTLDKAVRDGNALRRPVALVTGQLLILAWFVLFTVVSGASSARGLEIALAKLRGFPPGATIAFALLETVLVLLAAVPLGVLAGYAAVRVLARAALGPQVPVAVTGAALLAACGALAGALIAALSAAVRVMRQPVLSLLRRAGSGRRRLRALIAQLVLVAAAVLLLLRLARPPAGATPSGAALLAPGLISVVAALLAARLLPILCRAAFAATSHRHRVATFLAVRQIARRPAGLRVVLVLATAFGLASFAVVGDAVFRGNRADRARAETGAYRVLTVDPEKAGDLLSLVRRADPAGRAMAVVTYEGGSTSPMRLVGMDATRLTTVPYWRRDLTSPTAGQVAGLLPDIAPNAPVPAVVAGDQNAELTAAGLDGLEVRLTERARAIFVPRFGPRAAVADLGVLLSRTTRPIAVARAEVWLAPGSDGVVDRLRAAGLRIDIDERAATRSDRFGRQAPSLALELFLAGAGVAAVLALGGTVLDLYLLSRRRAFEVAAMAGVGVPRRTLVRSVLAEQALVLGTGTAVGVTAGLVAVRLTLPVVPEFSDSYSFPSVVLDPDPVFVAALVGGVLALLVTGIVAAALLLVRSAGPARLREAQP